MVSKKIISQLYEKLDSQMQVINSINAMLLSVPGLIDSRMRAEGAKLVVKEVEDKVKSLYGELERLVNQGVESKSGQLQEQVQKLYREVIANQPVTIELKEMIYNYVRSLYDQKLDEIDKVASGAIEKMREMQKEGKQELADEVASIKGKISSIVAKEIASNPEKYADVLVESYDKVIGPKLEDMIEKKVLAHPELYAGAIIKHTEQILSLALQKKIDDIFGDKQMKALKGAIKEVLSAQAKEYLEGGSDESLTKITSKIIENLSSEIQAQVTGTLTTLDKQGELEEGDDMFVDEGKISAHKHQTYKKLLACIKAGTMPMLVGPAGTGKSTAVEQVARELKLKFYTANRVQNSFELTGYKDASGRYQPTQFYQAYKNGGIFFLDEVDASSPDALVTINTAIAQGYMAFPCGRVNMHPDFKLVAAGNTYGLGADLQYVGRNQLDAATLDRFTVIRWDYDRELEKQLITNRELLYFGWALREYIDKAGLHVIISTRGLLATQKIIKEGEISIEDNIEMNLLEGLNVSSLKKILAGLNGKLPVSNSFYCALKHMCASRENSDREDY
mgnify:FL=1